MASRVVLDIPPATIEMPVAPRPGVIAAPARPSWATKHQADLAAVGIILLLTALFSWQRLWFWTGLGYLDTSTFYLPWYHEMGQAIRNFDIPGWNPNLFSGTAFAADPQSGWWYFPAMVCFTIFPAVIAYKAMLIFHLLLAGVSTLLYARTIGLRPIAALTAAVAFELGPLVTHISCCLIHVQLAVWFPVAFLGIELAARKYTLREQFAGCALTALAISQMIAGWIGQGSYNGLLVVGCYFVFRFLFGGNDRPFVARIKAGFLAGAMTYGMGVAIAAAGLWPRLDLTRDTNVAGGAYSGIGANDWSAGWRLPDLLLNLFSGGPLYATWVDYLGTATIALGVLGLLTARTRFRAPFFLILSLVAATMTLQHVTVIHHLLYLLPRFKTLHEHVPTRILAVLWIGPAMLAGIGVEGALARFWRRSPVTLALCMLAPWAVLVTYMHRHDETLTSWALFAAIAISGLATLLATKTVVDRPRLRNLVAAAMLLLVAWEPAGRQAIDAVFSNGVNPTTEIRAGTVTEEAVDVNAASTDPGGAGEFLQDQIATDGPVRFYGYDNRLLYPTSDWPSTYREWFFAPEAQDLLVNARPMMLGLYDVQGYDPVQMSIYVQMINAINGMPQNYHDAQVLEPGIDSPLLNLLGVRYIVVPSDVPPGRPDLLRLSQLYPTVFDNGSVRVLENTDALDRAWITHDVTALPADQQAAAIASGKIDPSTTTVIDASELPAIGAASGTDSATIESYENDRVTITANAGASGMLVLSDVYARGWSATVNGKATPIYRADGGLRAVAIPAGTSTIVFTYDPPSLIYGFWISVISMLAIAAILIYIQLRARAERAVRNPVPLNGHIPVAESLG